ncbi:putative ribonuclease H-like domain-containing protein [Tanacetum coccineum]
MEMTQLDVTIPRWSVTTATRWDTLQGNAEDLGTKIAETGIKTTLERLELEKLKQEKESNQLKIENFDNAFKSLNKLIGSKIPDKSRKDVGFVSYNVVPPPPTGLFSPPKFDLSNSGLEEFQQHEFKGYGPNTSKSVSKDMSNEVKESPDTLLVKELVSDDKLEKKIVFPTIAKIEFANAPLLGSNQGKGGSSKSSDGLGPQGKCLYLLASRILMEEMLLFGGGAKGGKITSKGTLKMATLDESMLWHRRLGKATQNLLFTWVFFLRTKDETSGILKSFITKIENLVDKKVKIIRCDNGTEFKNKVMIKAARTMLADFKLPTTFWAEEVNTACYVQNRVLVVKPHNKTPYEQFRGRTLAQSFMRPFECHVNILNTLDYLGKFDGKSDEGFFVGYSLNSKAFRVYNIKTRKVEENLHIRFLEDKPIIAGDGPKWLFDIDILTKSMNYVPVVAGTNSNDYVGSLFDSSLKNASNDEPQPFSDAEKKDDEGVCKESGIADQEKSKNNSQGVNTAGPSINTEPDMFSLGDNATATHADLFGDETEVNMSNITTIYLVPSTPNTRIHKDHSLDHVIGDVQSGVQTRRITKTTNEQGFISDVYEGKTYKDLHTYLFACFLSQEEPKKVIQALKDPSWIEAMQEELLQFKLQQVWTLVDLPHGKRAIGVLMCIRNKKMRVLVIIRNKARLVAHGYTQEERIDYDKVFAPVARTKGNPNGLSDVDVDNSRGVAILILLMEYTVLRDFLLHRSSINNSARLSNEFRGFYFSFKFGISGLLHHVVMTIADRIQELLEYMDVHDNDASESSQPSWGKMCTSGI